LEHFFHPILDIAVVMLEVFNEKFFDNNNCHLKFLSMEGQLLHKAVFIKKVNGRFASEWIPQTIFLDHIVQPIYHAIEANM
jgi:hypothetical protein